MIFFLNVIFCPKTAIVSKMCKDQDLGRVQKYSVPIKKGKKNFLVKICSYALYKYQTTCDNFKDFNIGF